MRRVFIVVAALGVVAAVAVVVGALRHGDSNPVVATVGSTEITHRRLDLTVEHFREEAEREGRPFPDEGSAAYDTVRKQALALLVDRAKVETAAVRLGVHVTNGQVERQLAATGGGEEESGGTIRVRAEAAFLRSTVRSQLVTEGVFRKLTARIRVSQAAVRRYYLRHRSLYGRTGYASVAGAIRRQLLAARRNAVVAAWLTRTRRSVHVEIRDRSLR